MGTKARLTEMMNLRLKRHRSDVLCYLRVGTEFPTSFPFILPFLYSLNGGENLQDALGMELDKPYLGAIDYYVVDIL